jgi:ABC-2 type transport system permease protein
MIAAILRAQLLSMRMGRRRGAVFSVITAVLWYSLWTVVAGAVGFTASQTGLTSLHRYMPLALLALFLYWQFVPIISASMGSALDMRKLLVYPVPHGKLFLVEVLLRLTSGLEMVIVLTGGFIGLLANQAAGGMAALPRLLPPALLFILFNLLVSSGLRSLLERLLSRRYVREFLALAFMLVGTLPRLVMASGVRPKPMGGLAGVLAALGLPWSAAARAALGESTALAILGLCGWTLLAAWFGRFQFERNLRYDSLAAQATPTKPRVHRDAWMDRFYRFPSLLWRDPLAAIVEKELRSLSRSPRFRMVFVMGFSFGLMVWLPLVMGRNASRNSAVGDYFLPVVCVYALTLLGQVSYWNCFGFDRSATAVYFVAPQPIVKVLLGKNIAHLIFVYLEVLILSAITVLLPFRIGHGRVP